MSGCFEVVEKVEEEVVWVFVARVFVLRGVGLVAVGMGAIVMAFCWVL